MIIKTTYIDVRIINIIYFNSSLHDAFVQSSRQFAYIHTRSKKSCRFTIINTINGEWIGREGGQRTNELISKMKGEGEKYFVTYNNVYTSHNAPVKEIPLNNIFYIGMYLPSKSSKKKCTQHARTPFYPFSFSRDRSAKSFSKSIIRKNIRGFLAEIWFNSVSEIYTFKNIRNFVLILYDIK